MVLRKIYNPSTKDIHHPPDPFLPSGKTIEVEEDTARRLCRRLSFLIDWTELGVEPTVVSDKVVDIEKWKDKAEEWRQEGVLKKDFSKDRKLPFSKTLWNFTNHQVIGGAIVLLLIIILAFVAIKLDIPWLKVQY